VNDSSVGLVNWLQIQGDLELSSKPIEKPDIEIDTSTEELVPIENLEALENSLRDKDHSNAVELSAKQQDWPTEPVNFNSDIHVIAWYQPMHFYADNWGIFILKSGLQEIMQAIASRCSRGEQNSNPNFASEIKYAAWIFIHLHEEFHHKVEIFAIRSAAMSEVHRYRKYNRQVFSATRKSSPLSCREEALCDAFALRTISSKLYKKVSKEIASATKATMKNHMLNGKGPYANSLEFEEKIKFSQGVSNLIDQIIEGKILPSKKNIKIDLFPEQLNSLTNLTQNSYLVDDLTNINNVGNSIFLALPKRKLEKVVSKHGYYKTDEGDGSHEKWKKEGAPFIILTNAREQSIKVIQSTAKTLGMTVEQLAQETRQI
jgi:hypothetical protein